jgi:hypothetical protein
MHRDAAAGIRMLCGGAVQPGLEVARERVAVGRRIAGRRHHSGTQLPNDLLPQLGIFRHCREVARLQRQAARPLGVAMAIDAVKRYSTFGVREPVVRRFATEQHADADAI